MCGGGEGEGSGDDLAFQIQCLQNTFQGLVAVDEQLQVPGSQIFRQRLFQQAGGVRGRRRVSQMEEISRTYSSRSGREGRRRGIFVDLLG